MSCSRNRCCEPQARPKSVKAASLSRAPREVGVATTAKPAPNGSYATRQIPLTPRTSVSYHNGGDDHNEGGTASMSRVSASVGLSRLPGGGQYSSQQSQQLQEPGLSLSDLSGRWVGNPVTRTETGAVVPMTLPPVVLMAQEAATQYAFVDSTVITPTWEVIPVTNNPPSCVFRGALTAGSQSIGGYDENFMTNPNDDAPLISNLQHTHQQTASRQVLIGNQQSNAYQQGPLTSTGPAEVVYRGDPALQQPPPPMSSFSSPDNWTG